MPLVLVLLRFCLRLWALRRRFWFGSSWPWF